MSRSPLSKKASIISKAESGHKWIDENHISLARKYNRKWIAVLERNVIDSDTDLEKLTARLKKSLGNRHSQVVIEYIATKPLNMVL